MARASWSEDREQLARTRLDAAAVARPRGRVGVREDLGRRPDGEDEEWHGGEGEEELNELECDLGAPVRPKGRVEDVNHIDHHADDVRYKVLVELGRKGGGGGQRMRVRGVGG